MQKLGYKLTWPETCFLGCAAKVWAHTEGNGDYVLLDRLGPPWEVHTCYENRRRRLPDFRLDDEMLRVLEELDRLKKQLGVVEFQTDKHKFATVTDTVRPEEYLGKRPFKKSGCLQFYREGRLNHFLGNLGAFDRAEAERIFANRNSELGIADAQGNLFICFADMRKVVISPDEFVEVQLSACRVPIPKLSPVFLCHLVERRPRPTHRRWDKD